MNANERKWMIMDDNGRELILKDEVYQNDPSLLKILHRKAIKVKSIEEFGKLIELMLT